MAYTTNFGVYQPALVIPCPKIICSGVSLIRTSREYVIVFGASRISFKRRTIQSRRRVPSPEVCPEYRVFRFNGVRYSKTYL